MVIPAIMKLTSLKFMDLRRYNYYTKLNSVVNINYGFVGVKAIGAMDMIFVVEPGLPPLLASRLVWGYRFYPRMLTFATANATVLGEPLLNITRIDEHNFIVAHYY